MKFFNLKKEEGFTLIEVMISIGLFTVIMIVGITAILGVNNTYRKSRTMRSAIDNLSFTMEDMARNIRLGSRYRCINGPEEIFATDIEEPLDGENCLGIAFEPFYDPVSGEDEDLASADQIIYLIEGENLFKGIRGANYDASAPNPGRGIPMNSVDLKIDSLTSGFTIFGSRNDDREQPSVFIILNGTVNVGGNSTDFNLQTTVSQRLLDYPQTP